MYSIVSAVKEHKVFVKEREKFVPVDVDVILVVIQTLT